jgi:APA family basic amino acid/polyamine antiporter
MNTKDTLNKLGLYATTAIVIGAVIGSGIFKKPAVMAEVLGSPELMLLIWVVAGLITIFGALTNAEIAGMITETGGQYVYFQKMYGNLTAYLYGWSIFAVIQTGSIASITYVFSEYTQYFFLLPRFSPEIEQSFVLHIPFIGNIYPLLNIGVKSLTIFVIVFLSSVNYLGVRFGGRIASVFTSAKVVAILILVAFGFMYADGSSANFINNAPSIDGQSAGLLGAIVVALSAAFWSYDGWNNVTYLAGEVKNPQKNLPLALSTGIITVLVVYILVNLAFIYVLPVEEMAGSELVASDVANRAIGPTGGALVAAMVMISTFGTSNGTIMASSRVYFAMARKKMFFTQIGRIHPKFRTPGNALILQSFWSSMLVLSGSFDQLTDMLIFVSWLFYALGAYGIFILRKKMPEVFRPYKVHGYPYLPVLFIVFALFFTGVTLYNDIFNYINGKSEIINSAFGLLLVFMGLPLYYYFKYKYKNKDIKFKIDKL